jgi:histidinol dehydrogenase
MRCERFTLELAGDAGEMATRIRDLVPAPDSVSAAVTTIIDAVRARGDAAVDQYTRQFDTSGAVSRSFRVLDSELRASADRLSPAVRAGLELAIDNVHRVAQARLAPDRLVEFGGHQVALREVPVARAAVYVPGGRAPYPSTVVMGVVTAKTAGVAEIVVCSPPAAGGEVDRAIEAACSLAGATEVYRMGGAQAIAALAYGTETVSPVDVIVGPGNLYVQEAKRQVFGQVGIDGFAGPSDLLVIADEGVDTAPIALDLLAQAEHGPATLVLLVSESAELREQLHQSLRDSPDTGAVGVIVGVDSAADALALAEAFAPEHLQLVGEHAEALAPRVTRSGCVFVGANAATAFGDYIAGSNHILPTNGAARYASGLTPHHFRRSFSEVRIADAAGLAEAAAPVARAEGFEIHARSMEARIRDNQES